ncbi:MAG: hypothetical protein H7A24_01215 [Leptospiraceae bacterium]|nr:hypothetical protein [Leptospiraceae bacterium]MCP5510472.1 hypothetical protein [Leptospiraceae bacterium]
MQEKQVKNKSIKEFKNYADLSRTPLESIPNVFLYVSTDTFEFDLIADYFKHLFEIKGEPFEKIIYVSETGDLEKLFADLFNYSMFGSTKLILIKSGVEFFKPLLLAGKKDMFENFRRNREAISDSISIVVHYNAKDLPAKMGTLFNQNYGLLKSRQFYNEERKKYLDEFSRLEKVSFSPEASDEFIHRTPPNTGSYLRNIHKLKNLLHKKHFELNDVMEILFQTHEFSPFHFADSLFAGNRTEVFREYSKMPKDTESHKIHLLSLLSILLNRADEVRRADIIMKRLKDSNDSELFQKLGMSSYSEGRKRFIKSRLKKETHLFSGKPLEFLYEILLTQNEKMKSVHMESPDILLKIQLEQLFLLLN